jgi:DNA invertase Pin-like site-specific DNA recombinase
MTPRRSYIPYYRVSTQKQGVSGLGLEAQQAAVRAFVQDPAHLLSEYVEIESGRKNQRPQLLAALAQARRVGSTLLIAKLDRLSRNASFILALRDSGVDFVCCDMPDANTLTVGLFAVLAQHERETISKRTRDALAAKKARGATLGNPQNMTPAITRQGQATMQRNAREHPANRQAALLAELLRAKGQTLWEITAGLNAAGYPCKSSAAYAFP